VHLRLIQVLSADGHDQAATVMNVITDQVQFDFSGTAPFS
jgi:hypothetical protein